MMTPEILEREAGEDLETILRDPSLLMVFGRSVIYRLGLDLVKPWPETVVARSTTHGVPPTSREYDAMRRTSRDNP